MRMMRIAKNWRMAIPSTYGIIFPDVEKYFLFIGPKSTGPIYVSGFGMAMRQFLAMRIIRIASASAILRLFAL